MTMTLTNGALALPVFELPKITDAPCAGLLDVFYPTPALKAVERNALVGRAQTICNGCRHQAECLASAIDRGEIDGVWGGQLFRDGEMIDGFIGPGRPRKAVAA